MLIHNIYSKHISLNACSPDYAVFKHYPFLLLWQLGAGKGRHGACPVPTPPS